MFTAVYRTYVREGVRQPDGEVSSFLLQDCPSRDVIASSKFHHVTCTMYNYCKSVAKPEQRRKRYVGENTQVYTKC